MNLRLLLFVMPLALSACTWVALDSGGQHVKVVAPEHTLTCTKRGEISVSVRDHVGPVDRGSMKVRDELETLARNEAANMGADTIQALDEPMNGEQRFAALTCGGPVSSRAATPIPAPEPSTAETYPVRGG